MKYRREVDGLRAIAVLPVILFHAGLEAFAGGFIGVDVFFVISGYLITTILFDEMSRGEFSISRFYERRARRILPAQYFIMLLTLPLGYFLMLPEDLENFGQSLVATVCFSNNILLYLTSGYWVMEVDFKPLVHTWSLAVEEQYYFIVPLLMLVAFRFGKKFLVLGMVLIFIGSLALSQVMASDAPTFNFLLIFTRAWELAGGALVALYFRSGYQSILPRWGNDMLAWIGSVLLFVSFLTFNRNALHPSAITLFPVAGTALILMCANSQNLIGRLLSGRAIVLIGLTSYSSYLWHQPIFAFARLVSLEEPAMWKMLFLSCLSLILAFLTWKYVEGPFRQQRGIKLRLLIPVFVVISLFIAGTGLYWVSVAGFSQSTPEVSIDGASAPISYQQYNQSVMRFKRGEFKNDGTTKVLVVGNSFARDFINSALANGYLEGHDLVYSVSIASSSGHAVEIQPDAKRLVANADYIIFASGYNNKTARQTMEAITLIREFSSAKLIVIGNKNFGWNNNAIMLLPEAERYMFRAKVLPGILKQERDALAIIPESIYVSIFDILLDVDERGPVFTPERKFISQDRRHFTEYGARYVGGLLFEHPLLSRLK